MSKPAPRLDVEQGTRTLRRRRLASCGVTPSRRSRAQRAWVGGDDRPCARPGRGCAQRRRGADRASRWPAPPRRGTWRGGRWPAPPTGRSAGSALALSMAAPRHRGVGVQDVSGALVRPRRCSARVSASSRRHAAHVPAERVDVVVVQPTDALQVAGVAHVHGVGQRRHGRDGAGRRRRPGSRGRRRLRFIAATKPACGHAGPVGQQPAHRLPRLPDGHDEGGRARRPIRAGPPRARSRSAWGRSRPTLMELADVSPQRPAQIRVGEGGLGQALAVVEGARPRRRRVDVAAERGHLPALALADPVPRERGPRPCSRSGRGRPRPRRPRCRRTWRPGRCAGRAPPSEPAMARAMKRAPTSLKARLGPWKSSSTWTPSSTSTSGRGSPAHPW